MAHMQVCGLQGENDSFPRSSKASDTLWAVGIFDCPAILPLIQIGYFSLDFSENSTSGIRRMTLSRRFGGRSVDTR